MHIYGPLIGIIKTILGQAWQMHPSDAPLKSEHLGRGSRGGHKFEAKLGYIVSFRSQWAVRPISKQKF
jgi:hypothetical protein